MMFVTHRTESVLALKNTKKMKKIFGDILIYDCLTEGVPQCITGFSKHRNKKLGLKSIAKPSSHLMSSSAGGRIAAFYPRRLSNQNIERNQNIATSLAWKHKGVVGTKKPMEKK